MNLIKPAPWSGLEQVTRGQNTKASFVLFFSLCLCAKPLLLTLLLLKSAFPSFQFCPQFCWKGTHHHQGLGRVLCLASARPWVRSSALKKEKKKRLLKGTHQHIYDTNQRKGSMVLSVQKTKTKARQLKDTSLATYC